MLVLLLLLLLLLLLMTLLEHRFQFASGLSSHYASAYWIATFERAATIFNDGTFRHAAMRMWAAMQRVNVTTTNRTSLRRPGSCSCSWCLC